jgi:spore coat protein A, manganese oxidase
MNPVSKGTGQPRYPLLVALLLTAGVTTWWLILPPKVLMGAPQSGLRPLVATALLVLPLALLAAGTVAWLARRQPSQKTPSWSLRRPSGSDPSPSPRRQSGRTLLRLPVRAIATAGLFAVLLLVTAPLQQAAHAWLAPPPIEPNLAAMKYDADCGAMLTASECALMRQEFPGFSDAALARAHELMMKDAGHSAEAHAAMTADFYPDARGDLGTEAAAYAIQDASIALVVALPLVFLGLYLAGRFRPIAVRAGPALMVPRRRTGLNRIRSRRTAVLATAVLVVSGNFVLGSATPALAAFEQPLYIPPVLTGSQVTLQMRQADVQVKPTGPPTRMWTYNGRFPGPTIRRPSGTVTKITFRNDLPTSFGSATIHHHGSHSRPSEDGQPNDFLIPPGGQRTYSYEHFERGEPEWAVTQWYHDHRMDVTGRNVWNGLAGMFILDDAVDSALPLPKGEFDIPLVIADRTFDANNQIPYVFSINPGTLGDTWLVNGNPQPHFNVGDRKYRFRVLNASNRRPVAVSLGNGAPLTQIATDSGLMPAPIQRTSILLQPAERAEFIVDFAGLLGTNLILRDAQTPGTPGNPPADLVQFRVNRDLTDNSSVPATLRPAPTFPAPVRDRSFVLSAAADASGTVTQWRINNQPFDSARIDADPVLNTTERWTFFNDSPQPHAIHLHDVDWKLDRRFLIARDANGNPIVGAAQPIGNFEANLKETFLVAPGTGFSVVTTFVDHVGKYVFHCHMLEHEDMAMMATFNVRAS